MSKPLHDGTYLNAIRGFRNPYRWMSNMYTPCMVTLDGVKYSSVEKAYQAAKSLDPDHRARVKHAKGPSEAKRLGRHCRVQPDWDGIKLVVMEKLLRQKFAPGTWYARKLMDTGHCYIEETNWWGDRFWGVCDGDGTNHMGMLLMKIRNELIEAEEI